MPDSPLRIAPHAEVEMYFSLRLEDGTVVDSTEGDEPLHFTLGDGTLVDGLELALYGLQAGDHQTLRIGPENAYGFPDPSNVHPMPRADFPPDMELQPGVIIEFTTPAGDEIPGMITEVGGKQVTVDFNHPLAGHEITFEVEIISVKAGAEAAPALQ
jgi:FKBP-type peptidyl-prolyl cis-trans isomerase SlpA